MLFKLIVFLPLVGFLIAGMFGRQIGDRASMILTSGLVSIAGILSWFAFLMSQPAGTNIRFTCLAGSPVAH